MDRLASLRKQKRAVRKTDYISFQYKHKIRELLRENPRESVNNVSCSPNKTYNSFHSQTKLFAPLTINFSLEQYGERCKTLTSATKIRMGNIL